MEGIKLAFFKIFQVMLYGLWVPVIGVLLLAYINQPVRRFMLRIMPPLAVLAIVALLTIGPRRPSSIEEWGLLGQDLLKGLEAGWPLLVMLALLGVLAFLFGPDLRERWLRGFYRGARREYLADLLAWAEEGLPGVIDLEGRAPPEAGSEAMESHLRITGQPGAGKSVMLRRMLADLTRRAQADEDQPLPVWIDLDVMLAADDGLQMARLESSLPVQPGSLGRLLKREAARERLIFLVDGSAQSYDRSFASAAMQSGGAADAASQAHTANQLARLAETFAPCRFILAMPDGVECGSLDRIVENELALLPLNEEQILSAGRAAARQTVRADAARGIAARGNTGRGNTGRGVAARDAARMVAACDAILHSGGVWRGLAERPWMLERLVRFYIINSRLPADVRELFRGVLYPADLNAGEVEALLTRLAEEVARTGKYWQPLKALPESSAQALARAGLLRVLPANQRAGRLAARVSFAHPILLAYFTALAWLEQRSFGPLAARISNLAGDPILADALIFFNNIEADPVRLAETLAALVDQPAGRFLAAQCLLAMPPAVRPAELAETVAARLVEQAASDPQAMEQAWPLLEPLEPPRRLSIYNRATKHASGEAMERILRLINGCAPNELRLILWSGGPEFSREAGLAWAAGAPREALGLFQELYERGPAERRALAIELLGGLPQEAVGDFLAARLRAESDPAVKLALLRALVSSGADLPGLLLEIASGRAEPPELRVYAAELLANSDSPELHSPNMVREIVRASQVSMPEQARANLQRLLDRLRGVLPAGVARWEEVVNPYVVGRPVTDPEQFAGREGLLRHLRGAVENASPVLITGERRMGKTSLLRRLESQLKDEARQGVAVRSAYLDMQGLEPHEFYETAIRALIAGLRDPNLETDPDVPRPYTDTHFARDLEELLEYQTGRLGPLQRLVLLIDDADTLAAYPPEMHAALRRVFAGAAGRGLALVLAGCELARAWQRPDPPFYAGYLNLVTPRLALEETLQLITRPVEGAFQYEPEALDCIWNATQGHPADTQALCQRIVGLLLERGERQATASLVQEAMQELNSPRAELIHQAERLLGGMMDWLSGHPDAPNAQVEEQMKHAWGELQKVLVAQVIKIRKKHSG